MTLEEFERTSAATGALPSLPQVVSAAVGQSAGTKVRGAFGSRLDERRKQAGSDIVVTLLGPAPPLPQTGLGAVVRYGCVTVDDFNLGTVSVLEQWPSPRRGATPKLHLVDADDYGERTLVDVRGNVNLIRANSAVYVFDLDPSSMPTARRVVGLGVCQLLVASDPFVGLYKQLEAFRDLIAGWNGLHSDPPNCVAIDNARLVLDTARSQTLLPDRIVAAADSVFIYFWRGDRYANIECENDGTILAVVSDSTGKPNVWIVNPDGLEQDLTKISAYLF